MTTYRDTFLDRLSSGKESLKDVLLGLMPDLMADPDLMAAALDAMVANIHQRNVDAGWWSDLVTGERKERNVGELLCLIHSEISEGLEGHRKNLQDTHLPHHPMLTVEMADAFIREADLCGGLKLSFGRAVVEKLAYNAQRQDHKREARLANDGKKI